MNINLWLLVGSLCLFTACKGSTPVPPPETIVTLATGAGRVACLLVPAADRPAGAKLLQQMQSLLATDVAAALKQLEQQAQSSSTLAYMWAALHAVLDPLATAAQWMANYQPAVRGVIAGCLETMQGGA